MVRLGQGEGQMHPASDNTLDVGFLFVRTVLIEHRDQRKISHDRRFVMQVVMQAQPFGRKVFAHHRDHQAAGRLPPAGFRKTKPQMSRPISSALKLRSRIR